MMAMAAALSAITASSSPSSLFGKCPKLNLSTQLPKTANLRRSNGRRSTIVASSGKGGEIVPSPEQKPEYYPAEKPRTPLLDTVNFPLHIRNLSVQELKQLADELRAEIIHSVSKTGGHLGSSLGVVELTIALHNVFITPKDRILWDVGHQTYLHKILTGRRDKMHTLRQTDGLSGFVRRAESEYDPFGAGHSSTSISAGLDWQGEGSAGGKRCGAVGVRQHGSELHRGSGSPGGHGRVGHGCRWPLLQAPGCGPHSPARESPPGSVDRGGGLHRRLRLSRCAVPGPGWTPRWEAQVEADYAAGPLHRARRTEGPIRASRIDGGPHRSHGAPGSGQDSRGSAGSVQVIHRSEHAFFVRLLRQLNYRNYRESLMVE